MKPYERGLLKFLKCSNYDQQDVLKNVKEGMGSLREIEGNPLFKAELGITVTKNYFLNGVQIAPAALPLNLQTELPFYLFGLSDSHTSYANSRFYFNGFEPWVVPDNLGFRLGPEMFPLAAALNPAWWDVFGAGWAVMGAAFRFNVAPGAGVMIRNNFWQPGRKYQIIWNNLFNPNANAITLGQMTSITNGLWALITSQSTDQTITTFITTPAGAGGTPNLQVNAATDVAGQVNWLNIFSIKEVLGNDLFTGDPAFGIYGFTKTNCLSNNVQRGDGIFTYAFKGEPTLIVGNEYEETLYTCEIIVHCNNIPYGSLLQSLASEMLVVDQIRYNVPPPTVAFPNTILQFNNPLIFLYQQMLGKMKSDSVDPNVFNTNKDFQPQICDIPTKFPIDRNLGIGSMMNFDINNLSFTFFVSKVEPLTLRSKYQ